MKRLMLGLALAWLGTGVSLAADPAPKGGTLTLKPKTADGEYDPALNAFTSAVSEVLDSKGFTIINDPAHTAYTAELILNRAAVGTGLGKGPSDPAAVMGTGVVVPLSTGQSSVITLRRTQLELRIRKRGQNDVVWHGTAVTVRSTGTRKGSDDAVATDLSRALLQIYPVQPEDTIGVP